MPLTTKDREFRYPAISYIDFKQLDMDRVLTAFLARLQHNGYPSRLARMTDLSADDFVDEFLEHPEAFLGFDRVTTRRWVETDLLDMVKRGKPDQAVAGPRPLHGLTYRFRNSRRSRPYGADEQLYEMLAHARGGKGQQTLQYLRQFFFAGVDTATATPLPEAEIDVETQALLHLATVGRIEDRPDTSKPRESHAPLCAASADLLADDVVRLLFHRRLIPRSVLIDYLKILFAFHLALYHLRIMKLLPRLVDDVRAGAGGPGQHACGNGACPDDLAVASSACGYQVGFFVDVAGVPGTAQALMAERSAALWFGRIPEFVRAAFTVKKLDEFSDYLSKRGKRRSSATGSVAELLALLGKRWQRDRDGYFEQRLAGVIGDDDQELEADVASVLELGLDTFSTYIEVLAAYRGDYHRKYLVDCLDTLMLKNRPGAMIAQPRRGDRRFILDSSLLEVLLQVCLLQPDGEYGWSTQALRVDQFVDLLRSRYGIHIDRLPAEEVESGELLAEQPALRANEAALIAKLREIGFYTDPSDAYLMQTITPRYIVEDGWTS